ncbi:MAG: ribbon-helix-helix domain-containing protein [Candidatus Woesearchaeota archaeon]
MVKMLSFQVEDVLAKDIDRIISKGTFSSRSEFFKDAIRKSIEKEREMEEWRANFDKSIKQLRKKAYANGYDGRMPTREERAKIADEYLEGIGLKYNKSKNRLEKI